MYVLYIYIYIYIYIYVIYICMLCIYIYIYKYVEFVITFEFISSYTNWTHVVHGTEHFLIQEAFICDVHKLIIKKLIYICK